MGRRRNVVEAVEQLGACTTWPAVFAVIEANRILIEDRATDRLLDNSAASMRKAGEPTVQVELLKALLSASRKVGTERATEVFQAVIHFTALGTWQEKCQLLLAEPGLLTDEALAMHGALAAAHGQDDDAVAIVRAQIR